MVHPVSLAVQSPLPPGGTCPGFTCFWSSRLHLDKAVLSLSYVLPALGLRHTTLGATQRTVVWTAGDAGEG